MIDGQEGLDDAAQDFRHLAQWDILQLGDRFDTGFGRAAAAAEQIYDDQVAQAITNLKATGRRLGHFSFVPCRRRLRSAAAPHRGAVDPHADC